MSSISTPSTHTTPSVAAPDSEIDAVDLALGQVGVLHQRPAYFDHDVRTASCAGRDIAAAPVVTVSTMPPSGPRCRGTSRRRRGSTAARGCCRTRRTPPRRWPGSSPPRTVMSTFRAAARRRAPLQQHDHTGWDGWVVAHSSQDLDDESGARDDQTRHVGPGRGRQRMVPAHWVLLARHENA